MTLQEKTGVIIHDVAVAGLQPVLLPTDAWSEFSHRLRESLSELEQLHAPARPCDAGRIGDDPSHR
ncbi:MAG: hypothetical protein AAGF31_08990 [Planctomycetota bacterium]